MFENYMVEMPPRLPFFIICAYVVPVTCIAPILLAGFDGSRTRLRRQDTRARYPKQDSWKWKQEYGAIGREGGRGGGGCMCCWWGGDWMGCFVSYYDKLK